MVFFHILSFHFLTRSATIRQLIYSGQIENGNRNIYKKSTNKKNRDRIIMNKLLNIFCLLFNCERKDESGLNVNAEGKFVKVFFNIFVEKIAMIEISGK